MSNYDPKSLAMPRLFVLHNGLRIITLSTPTVGTARMSVTVNSGTRDDLEGYEGTAHFLEHMMFQGSFLRWGTPERSAKTDIMQTFKDWGGGINAGTGKMKTVCSRFDTSQYSILDENLPEGADIVLDLVQHPRLKAANTEREREVIKVERDTSKNPIGPLTHNISCISLYPDSRLGHGIGTNESLDRITASVLREFWRKHYVPSNTTIYIQSKRTDEELLKIVTDRLTVLGSNQAPAPDHPPLNAVAGDLRVPFDKTDKLCYRFSWEVDRNGISTLNKRERLIVGAIQDIISEALHIKMRDNEQLVYSSGISQDSTGAMIIGFDSNKSPEKLMISFADVMRNIQTHLNQNALDRFKRSRTIKYIKFFENPVDVAFANTEKLIDGDEIYRWEDILKMTQDITLEELREMAARIFGKPFGMAVVGKPELLAQVPTKAKAEIEASMNITPNDKPLAGNFPMPDDIKPYDPRHGRTEPLPNPIKHLSR